MSVRIVKESASVNNLEDIIEDIQHLANNYDVDDIDEVEDWKPIYYMLQNELDKMKEVLISNGAKLSSEEMEEYV